MIIRTIKVVGTTFECRQKRIAALDEDAPVFFKEEKGNSYDPKAIAVLSEDGQHLGYIGRDDPRREEIRTLMGDGWVIARARKVGGFVRYDGCKASLGLRVQYYGVPADYGWVPKDEDDEPEVQSFFRDPIQKRKTSKRWKDEVKRHHKGRLTYQQIEEIKAAC